MLPELFDFYRLDEGWFCEQSGSLRPRNINLEIALSEFLGRFQTAWLLSLTYELRSLAHTQSALRRHHLLIQQLKSASMPFDVPLRTLSEFVESLMCTKTQNDY